MNLKIKERNFSIALLILFLIYLLFTIADLSTSRLHGFREADRSSAHRYLIVMTSYLFVYVIFNIRKLKLQQPLISLVLLAAWTMLINTINGVSTWLFLIHANMAVLWCLSYIFFNRLRDKESDKYKSSIEIFSYLIFGFYALATTYYFFDVMIRLGRIPVLNVVYYALALLPWIFVSNKNKKLICYLISIAVVMLSMKRGAVIAMVLMILVDSYVYSQKTHSYKVFIRVLTFVVFFTGIVVLTDNLSEGFFSRRFSEEELSSGSGRSEQFAIVWDYIKERGLPELVFGSGVEKSLQILGTGIHNEWLNFLFCYGLVGLLIYASLIFSFVKKSISVLKINSNLVSSCFTMTALYLVLSMVSTGYGGYTGLWLFGFWGYLNAELEIQNNRLLIGKNTNETM